MFLLFSDMAHTVPLSTDWLPEHFSVLNPKGAKSFT